MKANELNTGDWVLIKRTPSYECPYKICSINNYSILGEDYEDWIEVEADEEIKLEDIEPIPLTAEILEKNGFECIEVGDKGPATPKQNYMRYEHWRGETTWGRRDLFYDRMTKRWRFGGMNEYRLDSVHKLQHAIRFSGWDKEIEL